MLITGTTVTMTGYARGGSLLLSSFENVTQSLRQEVCVPLIERCRPTDCVRFANKYYYVYQGREGTWHCPGPGPVFRAHHGNEILLVSSINFVLTNARRRRNFCGLTALLNVILRYKMSAAGGNFEV